MRLLLLLTATGLLAACGSLPKDGPSSRQVERTAADGGYALIDLDFAATERLKLAAPPTLSTLGTATPSQPADLIGPGDTLSVTIFEAGGALFGRASETGSDAGRALPPLVVDRAGVILIPFAGEVEVARLTPQQAAAAIRRSLRGRAINPQVLVTIAGNQSNVVTVLGEVRTGGRIPLAIGTDRLLDVIAAAGGPTRPASDLSVAVTRSQTALEAPLSSVFAEASQNVRMQPGDQVSLIFKPRRVNAFGALGQVSHIAIEGEQQTLADIIGRAGGLDTNAANANSVLLFRFERPDAAKLIGVSGPITPRGVPVVYRLDFRDPSAYFVAANLPVTDEDLVYVPRSDTAELRKFFEFVQTVTRVVYDVTVTGATTVD